MEGRVLVSVTIGLRLGLSGSWQFCRLRIG